MIKNCLKCGHVNENANGQELEACPQCGAIYSRVEAAVAKKAREKMAGMHAGAQPGAQLALNAGVGAHATEARTKRADEKFCSECGSAINAKAEICPRCGVRQLPPPGTASAFGHTSANGKNKLVAGILAVLLGGIGVHKFYLGKGLQGVLYLVFCWTFIPAVLGLIEGLNYLLMSEKTFFERYGT